MRVTHDTREGGGERRGERKREQGDKKVNIVALYSTRDGVGERTPHHTVFQVKKS